MLPHPERTEIDHHTIKLIIGLIALSLATLTSIFSDNQIQSISASYYVGGWARNIFVGFLFAISAFLLAYNGKSTREMTWSKIGAVAGMGVAMFPCRCGEHVEIVPYVHGISAAVMFVILAIFCHCFYGRASKKDHPQARLRAMIYLACGITIVAAILLIAIDNFSGGTISSKIDRFTFYGEAAALIAFGIAWLTASHTIPVITNKEERKTLSPFIRETEKASVFER